jgi:ABC-2 type transport system permease protein
LTTELTPTTVASGKSPDRGGVSPRRSSGVALLRTELTVLFRRKRTLAMLAALAAVPILIAIAVRLTHNDSHGAGPAFLDRIENNGLFVVFVALTVCVPLFLPLTVGVVAGDTIAGEASNGTLRYLLISPAGRIRLLVVKYVGAAAFSLAATLVVCIAGAIVGLLLFPSGSVTILSGDTVAGEDRDHLAARAFGHRAVPLDADGRAGRSNGGDDHLLRCIRSPRSITPARLAPPVALQ